MWTVSVKARGLGTIRLTAFKGKEPEGGRNTLFWDVTDDLRKGEMTSGFRATRERRGWPLGGNQARKSRTATLRCLSETNLVEFESKRNECRYGS